MNESLEEPDARPTTGRVGVIGLGLIGGSVGLCLRGLGWTVVGADRDPRRCSDALEVGAVDEIVDIASMGSTDLVVVATPVGIIAEVVAAALDAGAPVVTDVGSVKGAVAAAITDPRFVPGHPMAGSEHEGVRGARPDLFHGAVWVLSPSATTADEAFAAVRAMVASMGADVATLDADAHDRLVAVVSHVPHLAAVTLMSVAEGRSVEHRALQRLAAGGFRDMTRIAAGHPGIWPDICAANAEAICEALDEVIARLSAIRIQVADGRRDELLVTLQRARAARIALPTGVPRDVDLAEVRIPVTDRPGELADITRLATDIDVNIYDLEIAHSAERAGGVLIVIVAAAIGERLVGALMANGYRPSIRPLTEAEDVA